MLFHVRMGVRPPTDMPADIANEVKTHEKVYSQDLQCSGKRRHIWRLVDEYVNISVFDVQSSTELHDTPTAPPLSPYIGISVTPLYRHPSSVHSDDAQDTL